MKYMIASDIHGSAHWCARLLEAFEKEGADRLLLLGDLLYHGPRNDLPKDYDTKKTAELLNAYKGDILCVRGNCEADVDRMMLDFSIEADNAFVDLGGRMIFATHGHVFNTGNPPALHEGDILLYGHTHVPACEDHGSFMYMNPGSVSIPKEESWHGYMLFEDGTFLWKDLETGEIKNSFSL
ncbi:MAG: phosphodiesterase [Mogibacterium sp.]|nr:phosphodiesterase [Mogibacterium sp.]